MFTVQWTYSEIIFNQLMTDIFKSQVFCWLSINSIQRRWLYDRQILNKIQKLVAFGRHNFTSQEWSVTPREKSHCMLFTLSDFGRIDVKIGKSTSCQFPGTKDTTWRARWHDGSCMKLRQIVKIGQRGLQDLSTKLRLAIILWQIKLNNAMSQKKKKKRRWNKPHWFDIWTSDTSHIGHWGQDCGALKIPTLWTAAFGESPEVEIKAVPCIDAVFHSDGSGSFIPGFFLLKTHETEKASNKILSIAKRCSNCIYYSSVLVYLNVFPWWFLDDSRVAYMAGILCRLTGWTPSNKAD